MKSANIELPTGLSPSTWSGVLGAVTLGFALLCSPAQAQLILDQAQTPDNLVRYTLAGPGVSVANVVFNGDTVNVDNVWQGQAGAFNGINTCLGMDGGIFLCPGNAQVVLPGPNNSLMLQTGLAGGGGGLVPSPDIDLSHLTGWSQWQSSSGSNIFGKSVLEFDFIPDHDMVSFRYVFSSEEYERMVCSEYPDVFGEYVGSQYNDVFGFFISGPGISGPFTNNAINIALIPGSLTPVGINTVNSGRLNVANANGPIWNEFGPCQNANPNWQADSIYYRYNGGLWSTPQPQTSTPQLEAPYNTDPYYIQHNGLTVVLTASVAVQCGETYHAKLGVGNVIWSYASALWLEQGSFTSTNRFSLSVDPGPNVDLSGTEPVLYGSSTDTVFLHFNRHGAFYQDEYLHLSVAGDAIAGVDYLPALPASIHFYPLDSAVVIPLAVPAQSSGQHNLAVNIITCGGDQVVTQNLHIDNDHAGVGNQVGQGNSLVLFPNPVKDHLYVAHTKGSIGAAELQMMDLTGRVLFSRSMPPQGVTLDVAHLPNGLYLLKAVAVGQTTTAKVQVQH